jgi:ABC-type methionine transport system ATPase subunit
MAKRHIKLVFPQELIKEPVVFTMAKKFDVVPNIRRARVTETVGEMTLELEGTEEILNQAVRYLESKGVRVESAMGDSVI